jgi:hypothetical protein
MFRRFRAATTAWKSLILSRALPREVTQGVKCEGVQRRYFREQSGRFPGLSQKERGGEKREFEQNREAGGDSTQREFLGFQKGQSTGVFKGEMQ